MTDRRTTSCTTITDRNLRGFVGYNMRRAEAVMKADLQKSLAPHGLRMMTFSALAMIEENRGLRPSQLASALSMERANLVVILDELERKGWISRAPSIQDRRAHALDITAAGQRVFAAANKAVHDHNDRIQHCLSADDRARLIGGLNSIENPDGDQK